MIYWQPVAQTEATWKPAPYQCCAFHTSPCLLLCKSRHAISGPLPQMTFWSTGKSSMPKGGAICCVHRTLRNLEYNSQGAHHCSILDDVLLKLKLVSSLCLNKAQHNLCHGFMLANASYSSAVAPSALQLVAQSCPQLWVLQSPAQACRL